VARRALTWALILPLSSASVLVGHAVAYRLTGADLGSVHDYLVHLPRVVAVLVLVALVGLAGQTRSATFPAAPFALLALVGFTVQEHLERYVHGGDAPLLFLHRPFLVGLLLQLPIALACLWVARRLIACLDRPLRRARRLPGWTLAVVVTAVVGRASTLTPVTRGRGPPAPTPS